MINDIQNVVAVNPIEQPNAILACVKQLRSTTDATTAASSWTSTIEHLSECESCGMKQKARNLNKTTSMVLNLQAPNQYLKVTSQEEPLKLNLDSVGKEDLIYKKDYLEELFLNTEELAFHITKNNVITKKYQKLTVLQTQTLDPKLQKHRQSERLIETGIR